MFEKIILQVAYKDSTNKLVKQLEMTKDGIDSSIDILRRTGNALSPIDRAARGKLFHTLSDMFAEMSTCFTNLAEAEDEAVYMMLKDHMVDPNNSTE